MKRDVKLRFCLVEDKIHDVSDFAHLSPKQRPEAFCPECENKLVLKLSNSETPKSRAHHAAHKAENQFCSLSSPEGILHFNTKRYIYEQLKLGKRLFIKQYCSGWALPGYKRNCSAWGKPSRPYLLLEDWDDVQMERSVHNLRPDIVLYRKNQPVAAIEICVTHAIDEAKKEKLREIGLPWVEVKADGEIIDEYFVNWAEEFEDEDISWKIEKPLNYENCFPLPDEWVCDGCQTAPDKYAEHLQKQQEREAREQSERLKRISDERNKAQKQLLYTQDQDNHIIKSKAIILLKPLGETELIELFVIERHNPEPPYKLEEIYLKLGRIGSQILISEEPITENSKRNLFEFYKRWLKGKEQPLQKVYHLTDWVTLSELEKTVSKYSLPYEWRKFQGWKRKE